jgi:methylation protein EvaC
MPATWTTFCHKAQHLRSTLRAKLCDLRERTKTVIGYGAPAKGTITLNYCSIGTDLVSAVIDSTPAKQGLYLPGTHQKIMPPEYFQQRKHDVALLLAWNHSEEITRREESYLAQGGVFLLPHSA